jgi:cytochrome c-type biogenesis protein CcmF
MIIAHLGVGLLILGITGSSVWQKEKITRMKINDETKIEKYNIVFNKIDEIKESNYFALQGKFLIYDEKKNIIAKLKPEYRFYPITNNFTTEASIDTNLFRDLYIVLGEGNLNDGWVVRIYYNPLVMWIWIGAFVIFLGGITSININLRKLKMLPL